MHVLILNQTFYPDVAATAQHMWDLAQHLESHGHRVTALTSRHLYGTSRPAGESLERIGTIEIHRVGGTSYGKGGLLKRAADFGSFYAAAALKLQHLPPPDVILALTSPPMVAALAMAQKQFRKHADGRRTRFVYHVMDLYPDAAVASGLIRENSLLDCTLEQHTARALKCADAVIALGRDMRERLIRRYGRWVRHRRIHVVPPWADGRELYPLDKTANPLSTALGLDHTFNIVYSGSLGIPHDLQTMSRAIEATANDPGLRWIFVGGGRRFEEVRRQAANAGWEHVRMLPYQERPALNQLLNLAHVHMVSQLPAFTGVVVPSKLFGSMAVGRPTVMVGAPHAECARILAEHGAGFVVPNGDAEGLVHRLRQLRDDVALRRAMGTRARTAFEQHYDRTIACDKIEAILTGVCASADLPPSESRHLTGAAS